MLIEAPFKALKRISKANSDIAFQWWAVLQFPRVAALFMDGDRKLVLQLNSVTQTVIDIEIGN